MAEPTYPAGVAQRNAAAVSPLQPVATNDRATVAVGCLVWTVLLAACLASADRLAADGRGWWTWTCLAGLVLGLAGLAFLQRKARRTAGAGQDVRR